MKVALPIAFVAALLASAAHAGPAATLPCDGQLCDTAHIRSLRFEGAGAQVGNSARLQLGFLLDQPATAANLLRAVQVLGDIKGVGGVDVRLIANLRERQRGTTEVVFTCDGRHVLVSDLTVTTRTDAPPVAEESWRLMRHMISADDPLTLKPGRSLHPYLLSHDREVVRHAWVKRGHREATVREELEYYEAELVRVVYRVQAGPQFRVTSLTVEATPILDANQTEAVVESFATNSDGGPPIPWNLRQDEDRLRAAVCERGYDDATVTLTEEVDASFGVKLAFKVTPGPRHIVRAVVVDGFAVKQALLLEHGLVTGAPFCGTRLEQAQGAIVAVLRDQARPDATIDLVVSDTPNPADGTQSVDLRITIAPQAEVTVERIWFEGLRVTREDVARQLLAIEAGELYRQSRIDTTVQNLLRSGLFRSADVHSIRGSRASRRYLVFTVAEQDSISVDVLEQTLRLRNLDLLDMPENFEELSSGHSLQGGGQELSIIGKPEHIGLRFEDRFLHRHLLLEIAAARRVQGIGKVDETWFAASLGFGAKALQGRLALVPFLEVERSALPRRAVFDPLPLAQGSSVSTTAGAELRAEFNRRDAERVPYLGADATALYTVAKRSLGGDTDFESIDTSLALNLPVHEHARGAHSVLRLGGRFKHLVPRTKLPGHRRLFPAIRGYGATAIGVPFEDGVIGGTTALNATLELRLAVIPLRRNAIAPFFDAATVIGEGDDPLERVHASAGGIYYFSFISERLEGFVYGAFPFRTGTVWEVFGAGIGGNF